MSTTKEQLRDSLQRAIEEASRKRSVTAALGAIEAWAERTLKDKRSKADDPETQKRVQRLLEGGAAVGVICREVGVTRPTLRKIREKIGR